MFDVVASYFISSNWPAQIMARDGLVKTGFRGESGQWNCRAEVHEHLQQALFFSVAPLKVPSEHRVAAAEFLTRANHGLHIGNFELDFDNGEVRYKTSIDVEGDRLTEALFGHLVSANVSTMDRYLPGIKEVAAGVDPQVALAEVGG